MQGAVVIMGVAGCGKSSLGQAVAAAEGATLVEGDSYHPEANREKMRRGVALDDEDRRDWLDALAGELASPRGAVVLTCSALKRAYRERLRAASPGLRFVYLELSPDEARARVAARAATHFFSPSLVESQFAALEPPLAEAGVLRVDAREPVADLQAQVSRWLRAPPAR
jgi:gluconokinase